MDVVIILGLIVLNGLLCLAELSLLSARRARLESAAERGDRRAVRVRALALAIEPTRFLSTVQIGITVIGILLGAFGEAALSGDLAVVLSRVGWLEPFAPTLSFWIVVVVVTYVSLVIGELVPKRIALSHPEEFARAMATPMWFLSRLAKPLVHFLTASTNLVLRPFASRLRGEPDVSEEEVRDLIARGTETGVFHRAEHDLMERVFTLGDQQVREIMLPRPDIEWIEASAGADEIRSFVVHRTHAQQNVPVCDGDIDHVVGVARVIDLLRILADNRPIDLKHAGAAPLFIPESLPAVRLIDMFKRTRQQCAIVVDEFGGTEGLVEFADLREAVLGRVSAPGALEEPDVVCREDGTWLLSGSCPASELKRILELQALPGEERSGYATIAGLILVNLGHLPKIGEAFEWDRYRLEVVDLDGRRIDKALLTVKPAPQAPEGSAQ